MPFLRLAIGTVVAVAMVGCSADLKPTASTQPMTTQPAASSEHEPTPLVLGKSTVVTAEDRKSVV